MMESPFALGLRDPGLEAHIAAEAHLDAIYYAQYDAPEDEEVESPESDDFCGCQTCVVREVLHVAWPILLEAARVEVAT